MNIRVKPTGIEAVVRIPEICYGRTCLHKLVEGHFQTL
jgi:hypothetical protein